MSDELFDDESDELIYDDDHRGALPITTPAPSLRAELAEAQATIARLTEESESKLTGYRQMADDWDAQYQAWLGIVVAATAYVQHQANVTVAGGWIQRLAELKRALVAAVEEGQKP